MGWFCLLLDLHWKGLLPAALPCLVWSMYQSITPPLNPYKTISLFQRITEILDCYVTLSQNPVKLYNQYLKYWQFLFVGLTWGVNHGYRLEFHDQPDDGLCHIMALCLYAAQGYDLKSRLIITPPLNPVPPELLSPEHDSLPELPVGARHPALLLCEVLLEHWPLHDVLAL